MANDIDQAIIDTLLRHSGINLPEIGSLSVRNRPAEFLNSSTITPPQREIEFSILENPHYPSAGALEDYRQWLSAVRRTGETTHLNGIGILHGTTFYPCEELFERLNPQGAEPVGVRRKRRSGGVWIAVAAVLLLGGVCAWFHTRDVREPQSFFEAGAAADTGAETFYAEAETAATGAEVSAETAATAEAAITGEEVAAVTAAENSAETAALSAAAAPAVSAAASEERVAEEEVRHYVVVGVFSCEENADKMIAGDPLRIGAANYGKVPFSGGKTLVSAYSSTDRQAAERRLREFLLIDSEVWIYTPKASRK